MKKIILIITIVVAVISCNNVEKYKTEISKIDNYTLKLDSIEQLINGIDFDSLVYIQKEASKNEKIIKTHYAPDTIDMVFAEKLNLNKGVRKSLTAVINNKTAMLKEINALKLQFNNLKHDITEGLYTKEQIDSYLLAETSDYNLLALSFDNFNKNQVIQKRNFYYANPQIAEYATQLLNELEH